MHFRSVGWGCVWAAESDICESRWEEKERGAEDMVTICSRFGELTKEPNRGGWQGVAVGKQGEERMAGGGYGTGLWIGVLIVMAGIETVHGMQEECAVEIYDIIFKPTLGQLNIPFAIVEFFGSRNPFCQEFKPHYERVACLFNDPNAVHAGEVYVTKVDCGLESNKGLCARFDVQTYPTLYWGPPDILASGGGFSTARLGLESVDGGTVNTAETLLRWINKRINKEYSLTDKKPKIIRHDASTTKKTPPAISGIWNLPATLHDVEEATAYAFSYMMDLKMMRASSRASFIQFLHLLERHHPSERCRKGSAKILENLAEWWPLRQPPVQILREQQLCGPDLPRGHWETCDGEGRGYSCGLWMLLHTLTVRVEDFEGTFAITAVEAFVDDFYKCDHCRDQFRNITSRNSADSTSTKKDVVLWLWRTHNKVTELVAREEAKGSGQSPRKLWPPENECPACRDSFNEGSDWDEETVYIYLMEFYGIKEAEIRAYQRSHAHGREEVAAAFASALGVPDWAALGMAMASAGFVGTICYSRTSKLKFKYRLA